MVTAIVDVLVVDNLNDMRTYRSMGVPQNKPTKPKK